MCSLRIFLLLSLLGTVQCFSPSLSISAGRSSVALQMVTESGMTVQKVKKQIDSISADNFESTLSTIEPFLLKDAGLTFYSKAIRRIKLQSKTVGKTLPTGYAKEAKATSKRREKQDAFIAEKESSRIAAEEAAAAAAAEEAAAAIAAQEAASTEVAAAAE